MDPQLADRWLSFYAVEISLRVLVSRPVFGGCYGCCIIGARNFGKFFYVQFVKSAVLQQKYLLICYCWLLIDTISMVKVKMLAHRGSGPYFGHITWDPASLNVAMLVSAWYGQSWWRFVLSWLLSSYYHYLEKWWKSHDVVCVCHYSHWWKSATLESRVEHVGLSTVLSHNTASSVELTFIPHQCEQFFLLLLSLQFWGQGLGWRNQIFVLISTFVYDVMIIIKNEKIRVTLYARTLQGTLHSQ